MWLHLILIQTSCSKYHTANSWREGGCKAYTNWDSKKSVSHQYKIFFLSAMRSGKTWRQKAWIIWRGTSERVQHHLRRKQWPNMKTKDMSTRKLDLVTQALFVVAVADYANPVLVESFMWGAVQQIMVSKTQNSYHLSLSLSLPLVYAK